MNKIWEIDAIKYLRNAFSLSALILIIVQCSWNGKQHGSSVFKQLLLKLMLHITIGVGDIEK